MEKPAGAASRRKSLIHSATQAKKEDVTLTTAFLKQARNSGNLSLAGRNMRKIPERIWTLYEPIEEESSVNYDLYDDNQQWWSFLPLQNLDLNYNSLTEISSQIEVFHDLEVLNAQDNKLSTLPDEIGKLIKILKLNLSHNRFKQIPNCLYKLLELRNLMLSHNSLDELSPDISAWIKLEKLDLSSNLLANIPEGMGNLINVTDLNLSHNLLIELPKDFCNMTSLTKLDLMYNKLKSLPALENLQKLQVLYANNNNLAGVPSCKGCDRLEEIYFGNNQIQDISSNLWDTLTYVKVLDLKYNKIEVLSDGISSLQFLCRFDISNNELTNLPNSLGFLANLQTFLVDGNKIRKIRREILDEGTARILKFLRDRNEAEIKSIETNQPLVPEDTFPDKITMATSRSLHVSSKDLTTIPDGVLLQAHEAEVKSVDISKNKIAEIPEILSKLSDTIKHLNISVNLLTSLPDFFSKFHKLTYLNIGGNLIEELPASFERLQKLNELIIINNKFNTIPVSVYKMKNLQILLASDNKISQIDVENLMQLPKLTTLDLSNNNLNYIPPELGNMEQLKMLNITGNSFRIPRYNVLAKGTEAILSYLRDRIPVPDD